MPKHNLWLNWAEIISLLLVVLGLILSLFSTSAVMSYIIIFLSGMVFGRLWYSVRKKMQFTYFLIIIGFLLGFLLGSSFIQYGNKGVMIIFFIIGWIFTYYLHARGIVFSKDF